jgi:hypothetical protein
VSKYNPGLQRIIWIAENGINNFGSKTRIDNHSEDLGLDGNIVQKRILGKQGGWEVVDWIHLAQDTDQWRALMNTVMKLRVP